MIRDFRKPTVVVIQMKSKVKEIEKEMEWNEEA